MIQFVEKENFSLYEIPAEDRKNFVPKAYNAYSEMECWMLKTIGNTFRGWETSWCWCDGCFEWWTDDREKGTSHHWRVFLTENGILILEDLKTHQMWRIS